MTVIHDSHFFIQILCCGDLIIAVQLDHTFTCMKEDITVKEEVYIERLCTSFMKRMHAHQFQSSKYIFV